MHDVAPIVVSAENIGNDLTERVGENSFVDMLDGRVNVFLGRGNAALTVTKVLIHVANVRICPAKAPNDKSSGTDRPSRSFLHNPYRRISVETAIPCISAWAIPRDRKSTRLNSSHA